MTNLRQRLIDAELAAQQDGDDPQMLIERTNDDAADAAVAVFVAYLRELADFIDRGIQVPLPPSVFSALVRERADDLEGVS